MNKYTWGILGILFLGISLPVQIFAQTTTGSLAPNDVCSDVTSSVFGMAKSSFSSMSITPGAVAEIPVVLKNSTKYPLSDIHLFMKVTRLGRTSDVVAVEYGDTAINLLPSSESTTTIRWATEKNAAAGAYRVDIFSLPSAHYVNAQVFTDVPAPLSVFVQVLGSNKASFVTFVKENTRIGDKFTYKIEYPPLFEKDEDADVVLSVRNVSQKPQQAQVSWKVYGDLRVRNGLELTATTTEVTIPPMGATQVRFPALPRMGSRYAVIAEVVAGGQRTLMPMRFQRISDGPLPINIFGIMQLGGSNNAFDIKKGKSYKLFTCPGAVSTLSPTTYHFALKDSSGKDVLTQSVVKDNSEGVVPVEFQFSGPDDIAHAQAVLTVSANGKTETLQFELSCGNNGAGDCASPPPLASAAERSVKYVIIILLVVFIGGYTLWKFGRKEQHHEK